MSNPEKLVTQDTHDEDIQSKNTTQCVETNTNNVNKTRTLLQTTGSKEEAKIVTDITTRNAERKET
jgi:hypothetical protein